MQFNDFFTRGIIIKLVAKTQEKGVKRNLGKFFDENSINLAVQKSMRALLAHFSIFQWERSQVNLGCQNLSLLPILVRAVPNY